MKKILSLILALAAASSLLSACSFGNDENMHTLYFRNISESKEVVATFFNSVNDETSEVKMKKSSQDDKTFTYSCEGDTSKFNMAYITYDGITTDKFAFNKCVSGWFKTEQAVMPYAEGCSTTYKYNSTEAEFNFCGYKNMFTSGSPMITTLIPTKSTQRSICWTDRTRILWRYLRNIRRYRRNTL